MKIEVTTKYNVGDVLYYADFNNKIVKEIIEEIRVFIDNDNKMSINYGFKNRDTTTESIMGQYYSETLEGAANLIAQRAVKKYKETTK